MLTLTFIGLFIAATVFIIGFLLGQLHENHDLTRGLHLLRSAWEDQMKQYDTQIRAFEAENLLSNAHEARVSSIRLANCLREFQVIAQRYLGI